MGARPATASGWPGWSVSARDAPAAVLDLLQQAAAITAQMLERARADDWDALGELEAERQGLLTRIDGIGYRSLSPAERPRARAMIEAMLRDNEQTTDLARDWMVALRRVLSHDDIRERIRAVVAARAEGPP